MVQKCIMGSSGGGDAKMTVEHYTAVSSGSKKCTMNNGVYFTQRTDSATYAYVAYCHGYIVDGVDTNLSNSGGLTRTYNSTTHELTISASSPSGTNDIYFVIFD